MTDLPITYSGPEPEDEDFKQSGLMEWLIRIICFTCGWCAFGVTLALLVK